MNPEINIGDAVHEGSFSHGTAFPLVLRDSLQDPAVGFYFIFVCYML